LKEGDAEEETKRNGEELAIVTGPVEFVTIQEAGTGEMNVAQ